METHHRQFYLEDLVGSRIVSPDRRLVGHVVDVQVSPAAGFRVTGLMYGRYGWLYRLHVLEPFVRRLDLRATIQVIPWRAVDHFEHFTVTLKPGWQDMERYLDVKSEAGEQSSSSDSGQCPQ
jgi:hypothetical protein